MATRNSQRIGILIIAVVMVIGTIGSFAVLALGTQNDQRDATRQQEAIEKYQNDLNAQNQELSKKYYPVVSEYADRPTEFEADSVQELKTRDLRQGDGKEIDGSTAFAAYYIGWNPDGKIFDQSIDGDSLKSPLPVSEGLDQAMLIEGWKEGMKGMKIGGVRLIEIPADLAYGEAGGGDDIPPNTPIKFIVLAIEEPEQIEIPAILQRNF